MPNWRGRSLDSCAMVDTSSAWHRTKNIAALFIPWIFVRRFSNALRWVQAGQLCSDGHFEEALRCARAMSENFRHGIEWRTFEIQQLALLHWDHETIEAVNAFVLKYEYPTERSADRTYLLAFAKWCGANALARYAPESPPASAFEFDLTKIVLSDVSARYKRRYPLTIHPAWDETSPFHPNNRIRRPPPVKQTPRLPT